MAVIRRAFSALVKEAPLELSITNSLCSFVHFVVKKEKPYPKPSRSISFFKKKSESEEKTSKVWHSPFSAFSL
jgi:hypothetical protein